ncbi:MAG: hypothetical protein WDN50_08095 [Bradyrhizobium sp.]
MLTEFDQSTIANMTAALNYVCKKIPMALDGNELRKMNCGRASSMCAHWADARCLIFNKLASRSWTKQRNRQAPCWLGWWRK